MTQLAATRTTSELSDRLFGIWAFIVIECVIFSAYFVLYLLYRMHAPETFAAAQAQLSPTFGCVNTLILLASSWQVARSLHAARAADYSAAVRSAIHTIALGTIFATSKLTEWSYEIRRGYTFSTNDFFSFYFFLTGIHVVHVLIGVVFMAAAIHNLRSSDRSHESIEVAATYWHMVDFLWVVIFALLYLVR